MCVKDSGTVDKSPVELYSVRVKPALCYLSPRHQNRSLNSTCDICLCNGNEGQCQFHGFLRIPTFFSAAPRRRSEGPEFVFVPPAAPPKLPLRIPAKTAAAAAAAVTRSPASTATTATTSGAGAAAAVAATSGTQVVLPDPGTPENPVSADGSR